MLVESLQRGIAAFRSGGHGSRLIAAGRGQLRTSRLRAAARDVTGRAVTAWQRAWNRGWEGSLLRRHGPASWLSALTDGGAVFWPLALAVAAWGLAGLNAVYSAVGPGTVTAIAVGLLGLAAAVLADRRLDLPAAVRFTARAGGCLLGGVLAVFLFQGRGDVYAVALVLGAAGVAVWRRPLIGVWAFLVLLPFHHFGVMVADQTWGLSAPALLLLKAWKDVLLAAIVIRAAGRFMSGVPWRWYGVDAAAGVFLVLLAYHVLTGMGENATAALQSLRLYMYFLAVFYSARVLGVTKQQVHRLFAGLVVMGVAAAAFAWVEKTWNLSETWVALGYVEYLREQFGQSFPTPNGLPYTFWTEGYGFRRAGSFFLGPIDMSYAFLLIVPATVWWYRRAGTPAARAVRLGGLALLFTALFLGFSRAAIVAVGCQCLALAWLWRREVRRLPLRLLGLAFAVLVGLFFAYDFANLAVRTVTFQESSAAGHAREWRETIETIQGDLSGEGLGQGGFVGSRYRGATGGENQYLIAALELGVAGALLFFLVLAAAVLTGYRSWRRARDPDIRSLTLVPLAGLGGMLLVGLTSQVFLNFFLIFLGWWLLGTALTEERGGERRTCA